MPRLLFYAVLAVVIVTWIRRYATKRSDAPSSSAGTGAGGVVRGMPKRLVCGACGKEYEPLTNGWLCPVCHK